MRLAALVLLLLTPLAPADSKRRPAPPAPPNKTRVWIHAPAEDLLALFPERGAGFLISAAEYAKLVDLAQSNEEHKKARPPLAARLVRGTAEARLDGDVLRLTTTFVAVVHEGGASVPFPLEGIALESIAVEGGELVGQQLRFEKPGTFSVSAILAAKVQTSGERKSASFRLPPAAAHTVSLALPPQSEGEVGPIVRAFSSGKDGGRVVGYPDEHGVFTVWIAPRSPARELDPLLSATFDARGEVGEARTVVRTALRVEVLRAPIDRLSLALAKGETIRGLTGKGIKSWHVVRDAAGDRLDIQLVQRTEGVLSLGIESEIPRNDFLHAVVTVPRLKNAVRFSGNIAVRSLSAIRFTGMTAEGARRRPVSRRSGDRALFSAWTPDAKLTFNLERIAARTRATLAALLGFREGGKSLRIRTDYHIAGRPLFQLEPAVPAGWIVRRVRLDGRDWAYRYAPDGRIVLQFPHGLKPGLHRLDLRVDTDEVDWVPGDAPVSFDLAGVRSGLEDERGTLYVMADRAFRVSADGTRGLEKTAVAAGSGDRLLYAWRFAKPDFGVRFTLRRHRPVVRATVVTHLAPSERLLRVRAIADFDIKRTGVRTLKVALPKGTGPLVEFTGPYIKERRAPAADADPETWTIVFQKRVRGRYQLHIGFEKKFGADAWTTTVPDIALPDVQDQGFLVVHPAATTELTVDRGGLREADVGELPQRPARAPLEVLAYAKHPFQVRLSSKKHESEPVVQAIALSAHVYGVLTPDGLLRCRAEYSVRNNDQPFLSCRLPGGAVLLGVTVDGNPQKPLLENGALRLPLPRSKNRETPFPVAVVYESRVATLEGGKSLRIDRPALDVDVLKTRYTLHLPRGYTVANHDGDLVPLSEPERRTVLGALAGVVFRAKGMMTVDGATGEPELATSTPLHRDSLDGVVAKGGDGAGIHALPQDPPLDSGAGPPKRKPSRANRVRKEKKGYRVKAEKDKARDNDELLEEEVSPDESADDAEFEETAGAEDAAKDAPFRGPNGGVAPGLRTSSDPEPPAAPPADGPTTPSKPNRSKSGIGGGGGGGLNGRGSGGPGFIAQQPRRPTPGGSKADGRDADDRKRRTRPERALLSLDIHPLRPDNLVRFDSLAPTGSVEISLRHETHDKRAHYLGLVLGALAGLFALVRRLPKWRLLPAIALGIAALHFGGLSFVPSEFAVGAAQSFAAVFVFALVLVVIPRRRPRWLQSRIAGALLVSVVMINAATGQDGDVLVPYGDDPHKIDRVFLPAKEYHRLRALAYPETTGRRTALRGAKYSAVLKGDDLTVLARYEIVKETEETERLPLGLNGAAVTNARIGDRPATLKIEKSGYVLVLKGKGRFVLDLTLRPRLADGRFSIPVRPVADAQLAITHDRADFDVDAVALGGQHDSAWHLGPVGVLSVTWKPKTRSFRAATAELRAQTETVIAVRDGFTGVATRIRYGIAGGKVDRLRLRLGQGVDVRRVACAGLAGWQVQANTLIVALRKPAERALTLTVHAERAASARERTESFPEIAPLDVVRDAGVIAVETLPDLKLEVVRNRGLLRGTKRQWPRKLVAARDRGAFHSVQRYAVRPFELAWRVYLEPARLRANVGIDVLLDRRETRAVVSVRVERERGTGPFTIALSMPAGFAVTSIEGRHADWWERDGFLHVDLGQRLQNAATLRVHLRRPGATGDGVTAPAITVRGAVRQRGRVRVAVADGLDLQVDEENGLLPRDVARAGSIRGWNVRRLYEYVTTPWRLVAKTKEEPRELEALVVSRVVPLADRVRVEALATFHVRRGLVDEVSFVVPLAEEGATLVHAPDLREERSEEVANGRRFTLLLRRPTRGAIAATIVYHVPYGTLIRGVEPSGVVRIHRYVAVEKVADGEVRVQGTEKLDPGGFDDLPLVPAGTTERSVAAVFVGASGPFSLNIAVRRHQFEEVAKAVIYRAAARAVVESSGWARCAVQYRVYNRSKQFLRLRLPEGAHLYSVLVAGEGVRPLGEDGDLLVPLKKVALGAPTFDVDIVYAYEGRALDQGAFSVQLPQVRDLEVRRTTLSLYVPRGFAYDFETDMKEVGAENIAAGEADDMYQEVQELANVVELGNELQSQRARYNLLRVQQEANRLLDNASRVAREDTTRKKVVSQKAALDALTRSLRRTPGQTKLGKKVAQEGLGWAANKAYIKNATEEGRRQVRAYDEARKQQDRRRQDTERRERQDRKANKKAEIPASKRVLAGLDGKFLQDKSVVDTADIFVLTERSGGFDDGFNGLNNPALTNPGAVTITFENSLDPRPVFQAAFKVGSAKGRISLRVDLPLEGEVYHFARLGGEGAVTMNASKNDGRLMEGALAVFCFAAAAAILFLRRR